MDQDRMNNLYRGLSIDASNQVSDQLAMLFQRRRFLEIDQSETRYCLWRQCLPMDWNEMSTLYRGQPIDASYHVSDHLAKRFQRRLFLKSANQKQASPVAAMFVNGSGRNEQSL